MLLGIRHILACMLLGIGMIAIFGVYRSKNSLSYCLVADPLFSAETIDLISAHITQQADIGPEQLCQKLVATFSSIQQITARCSAQRICTVSVAAEQPLARLSNGSVLTLNGKCVTQECFVATALESLREITLKNRLTEDDAHALCAYLKNNSSNFFSCYDIAWKNKHEIFFHDKQADILFIADLTTVPDANARKLMTEQIVGNGTMPHKKQKTLVADIRFDHQFIVYGNKGAYHGNSIF